MYLVGLNRTSKTRNIEKKENRGGTICCLGVESWCNDRKRATVTSPGDLPRGAVTIQPKAKPTGELLRCRPVCVMLITCSSQVYEKDNQVHMACSTMWSYWRRKRGSVTIYCNGAEVMKCHTLGGSLVRHPKMRFSRVALQKPVNCGHDHTNKTKGWFTEQFFLSTTLHSQQS